MHRQSLPKLIVSLLLIPLWLTAPRFASAEPITALANNQPAIIAQRVLISGGSSNGNAGLKTADIYDPTLGTFAKTGAMKVTRFAHTQTLLDDGNTIVAGGTTVGLAGGRRSANLYTPSTGKFTKTGSLKTGRYSHTATLLNDGTVLVAGGQTSTGALSSAESYDPTSGKFTKLASSMTQPRFGHTATLMADGTVLIVGGDPSNTTAEIYFPSSQTFAATGSLNSPRSGFTATLLNSGEVLIAGGSNKGLSWSTAELYNPASQSFTPIVAPMTAPRTNQSATLLDDGRVLIAGGCDEGVTTDTSLNSAELYDPIANSFTVTGSMSVARCFPMAMLLASNNHVLVAGGSNNTGVVNSGEIYDPVAGGFALLSTTMSANREFAGIGATP